MPRYTLTISPDYVKDWTAEHAIREFLQNAIDQESADSANKMTISFTEDSISIANKTSKLPKSTLLLGGGTKDGTNTIGQFGEGYKIAMLVLLREGYKVEIRNYGFKELWTPKIVNSKIYESKVLAIDTREYDFGDNKYNSLEIVISGLDSPKEFVNNTYLKLRKSEVLFSNNSCEVLDLTEAGNVYIGGLLIGKEDLKYGYNFNPGILKIGRDRNIIAGWDLYYETSRIWVESSSHREEALSMLEDKAKDVQHSSYFQPSSDLRIITEEKYKTRVVASNNEQAASLRRLNEVTDIEIVPEVIGKIMSTYYENTSTLVTKDKSVKEQLLEVTEAIYEDFERDSFGDMYDRLDALQNLINKVQN